MIIENLNIHSQFINLESNNLLMLIIVFSTSFRRTLFNFWDIYKSKKDVG